MPDTTNVSAASPPLSLDQTLDAITAELRRREAAAKASTDAWRAAKTQRVARLEGIQGQFMMWCNGPLAKMVHRADERLNKARCSLTRVDDRWMRFCDELPPHVPVTKTVLTLRRAESAAVHQLTLTLYAGGTVRVAHTSNAIPGEPPRYPDIEVTALDGAYAERLVAEFVARGTGAAATHPQ